VGQVADLSLLLFFWTIGFNAKDGEIAKDPKIAKGQEPAVFIKGNPARIGGVRVFH